MRIAEGWVTAARGPTLSAAAVATDFLRNDLRDAFIIFLPSPEAYVRSVTTVIEVGAESTSAWVGQSRGWPSADRVRRHNQAASSSRPPSGLCARTCVHS